MPRRVCSAFCSAVLLLVIPSLHILTIDISSTRFSAGAFFIAPVLEGRVRLS